jgi:hypothetical protein
VYHRPGRAGLPLGLRLTEGLGLPATGPARQDR